MWCASILCWAHRCLAYNPFTEASCPQGTSKKDICWEDFLLVPQLMMWKGLPVPFMSWNLYFILCCDQMGNCTMWISVCVFLWLPWDTHAHMNVPWCVCVYSCVIEVERGWKVGSRKASNKAHPSKFPWPKWHSFSSAPALPLCGLPCCFCHLSVFY